MNEQNIMETLMQNPEFKKALRELLIHDKDMVAELCLDTPAQNVYVWCAEMVDANGKYFYHPIIAPSSTMMTPDIDYMMDVENYSMMASENQFEAYKYEPMIKMFSSVYRNIPAKLIAVPKETFDDLDEALGILVINIIDEVAHCFDHLDRIVALSNTSADMLKMNLLASVFGNMTTVAACFDREMDIHESVNHEYTQGSALCDEVGFDEYDDDDN